MENQKLQVKEKFDHFFDKIAVNVPMLLKKNQQFYAIIPKLNWFYVFAAGVKEKSVKGVRQFKRAKEIREFFSDQGALYCDVVLFKCQQRPESHEGHAFLELFRAFAVSKNSETKTLQMKK